MPYLDSQTLVQLARRHAVEFRARACTVRLMTEFVWRCQERARRRAPAIERLASRLRDDADVGLRRLPALRIHFLRVFVRHRPGDDHVFALLPVYGRRD